MDKVLIKRGDTFLMKGKVAVGNVVQDITAWGIVSQIRDPNNEDFLVDLTVTKTEPADGIYTLEFTDTSDWPIAVLNWDVQYTTDTGQVISTQTVQVDVRKDITK